MGPIKRQNREHNQQQSSTTNASTSCTNEAPPCSKLTKKNVADDERTGACSRSEEKHPKPRINIASSDFSIIKNTDHFIDKTKLIDVLFEDTRYVPILTDFPKLLGAVFSHNSFKKIRKVYQYGHG